MLYLYQTIYKKVKNMKFEWDNHKNENNKKKYQIDFEIAKKVFNDPNHITGRIATK